MSGSSDRSVVSFSIPGKEIDPLLKDLNEKKQSFRKNVVSLAAELKDVRSRLASREQLFAREALSRQEAETRARTLEEEIDKLNNNLEEKNEQILTSADYAQEYLKELDALRSQLAITQATADASSTSAQSAQIQCLALLKELEEKNVSIMEHESRVNRLAEQLDNLQKDLQARESSQKQLQDEVFRIEHDIMQAVVKAGMTKDGELRKIMEEVSPESIDNINKLLLVKDEEIAKLKDEIRTMSSHWKIKTHDLESQVLDSFLKFFHESLFDDVNFASSSILLGFTVSSTLFIKQLEKQRRADQDLKKKVLKLEFCLQEARTQTRKLQRLGERREKALKELKAATKQPDGHVARDKQNFWETSGFKVVASMSMLILVLVSKR